MYAISSSGSRSTHDPSGMPTSVSDAVSDASWSFGDVSIRCPFRIGHALNAGWVSDQLGRRRVLLASQLSTAAATAAFAFMRNPAAFAVIVVAFGIAIIIPNPVLRTLVADVVRAEDRARAYATTGWATAAGAASAPSSAD